GSTVVSGTRVFLKTAGPSTLPTFTGWSLQSVLTYEALTGLSIETNGEGFVVSQSVSAGTQVTENTTIVLRLQTPEERFTPQPEDKAEQPLEPKLPDGYEGLEEGESLQQFDNPNIEPGGVG
ncbi:MAG TPA: PASTA domain-containing protein, partial [Metalysinibacillus sp.]